MNTVVLSGSIRSNKNNLKHIKIISDQSSDLNEYTELCKSKIDKGARLCNSDILAGAAIMAMRHEGMEPVLYSLSNLFSKSVGNHSVSDKTMFLNDNITVVNNELENLIAYINDCSGIVLISPVYFGDRSSVANKFIQLAGKYNFLQDKVFGAGTVGAKRNGGQETATLYCLFEALRHQSIIVGNGPPTSQYGGTAIGGHRGTVISDEVGLITTYGVANRVSQVVRLIKNVTDGELIGTVKILILLTMDESNHILLKTIKEYTVKMKNEYPNAEFTILNILKMKIYRCLGCRQCPAESFNLTDNMTCSTNGLARCVITNKDDDMHTVYQKLIQSDGILIAGLNVKNAMDIVYRYQVLIERTRYIRRDHFRLTNKLLTSFTLHEVGATVNQLHYVKTITSYVRHNVVISSPIEIYMHAGKIISHGYDAFRQFLKWSIVLKKGRDNTELKPPEYLTTGIGGYEP